MALLVGNQKGGTGKTTVSVNVGFELARLGVRTLLIDGDPHHGTTSHCGIEARPEGSLAEYLTDQAELEQVIVREPDWPAGFHVVPGSRSLEHIDRYIEVRFGDPAEAIAPRLRAAAGTYDLMLIDTGPTLSTPTRAAHFACDGALLVAEPHVSSVDGLYKALADVQSVDQMPGRALAVAGIVINKIDRRTSHLDEYRALIEERGWLDYHFDAGIRQRAQIRRAWHHRRPLALYAPDSPAIEEFQALARAIIVRLELRSSSPEEVH